jgi:two-component sensor histidine kinase
MALIHQTLYQSKDFADIDFGNFLHTLGSSLLSSYGVQPDRVKLGIATDGKTLPLSLAVPCGLIVNEIITNALKHAFPGGREGRIDIAFEDLGEDAVRLTVSDDGVGIPEVIDFSQTETLGMQLVHLLADQLRGELHIRRTKPTSFALTFPVRHDEEMP